ncbi:CoA transferase [Dactylosporangium sp. AC04546]|uniref:CoA transferase n=1 Tax=Dactylosporangium sp. AC04546 TaxID=2862460 RepID=UPI001EDEE9CA|nr:CoA transferase [Dactylosporangium sp. AC04546]WVK81998.1 CoA transferase [Dactylosporangium sp. AC04546]
MRTDQPVNTHEDLLGVVDGLLEEMGLDRRDAGGTLHFAGLDPLRPTVLKVGAAAASIAAAGAITSTILWRQRGGEEQDIYVDLRKAYAYQSPWQDVLRECTLINGTSVMVLPMLASGIFFLPTRDNRFVLVLPAYPSQQAKAANLFRCGLVYDQLAQVARQWDAADLEAAGQELVLPISMVRTEEEFRASDHWRYHATAPLIQIEKIGESEPEPLSPSSRPLSGVRALGMTHVVAGPVVLRQLAAAGADCLNLNMPDYTEDRMFLMQSDAGVRQAYLDARRSENRNRVYALVKDADVFVENLRPQRAASEGYAAEDLAAVRPGIISARIKLNTTEGPWANWVGFDLSAGAFTGLYTAEGSLEQPRLPGGVNVVVDFLCGMLVAAAVQAALIRRATEGGSYRITITLAQVTTFEMSLGLNDKAELLDLDALGPEHKIQQPNLVTRTTPFGEFTRLGSQVEMSKTPEFWADPILVPIGSSRPEWLPKPSASREQAVA